jgi:predicted N-formylglutamate amidohydrolase
MKRHGESNGLDHAVLEFRNDVISRQSEIVHWTKLVSEAVAPSHRTISRTHGED